MSPELSPRTPGLSHYHGTRNVTEINELLATPFQPNEVDDWFGPQVGSTPSTTAGNTNVAAVRWLDVLTNDVAREALSESRVALDRDCGPLDLSSQYGQNGSTPLQRATRIVDNCLSNLSGALELGGQGPQALSAVIPADDNSSWQSREDIALLPEEETLFADFLRRISSWVW